MAAAETTIEGTEIPEESAGLPQLNPETFPSQVFWLAVTFGLLFLVLWRVVLPKINAAIANRRYRIEDDLTTAENLRKEASVALSSYEAALAAARGRALSLAEENRKRTTNELDQLKASADAEAQNAMMQAERRIAAERAKAEAKIRTAAADAAVEIVQHLIGASVNGAEAEQAVAAVSPDRG